MNADQVSALFNASFEPAYQTRIEGGADEPLYQPGAGGNVIYFRADYVSSALHEIAHWCIAGSKRRQLVDYGYWYESSDARESCATRQSAFEASELAPQGLEWIFSKAAGVPFRVSCDNFSEDTHDIERFRRGVRNAAQSWIDTGLPGRARQFVDALVAETGNRDALCNATYREPPR